MRRRVERAYVWHELSPQEIHSGLFARKKSQIHSTPRINLTLQSTFVSAQLSRKMGIGVLDASPPALCDASFLLRPHIRAGLLEHGTSVRLGGIRDVRVCEGRTVPAKNAVAVLLCRC
jgi:hypothetical protein